MCIKKKEKDIAIKTLKMTELYMQLYFYGRPLIKQLKLDLECPKVAIVNRYDPSTKWLCVCPMYNIINDIQVNYYLNLI